MIDFIGIDKLINEGKRVISFCLIFKLHENKSKIEIFINLAGSNKSTLRTIFRNTDLTLEKMAFSLESRSSQTRSMKVSDWSRPF